MQKRNKMDYEIRHTGRFVKVIKNVKEETIAKVVKRKWLIGENEKGKEVWVQMSNVVFIEQLT